MYEFFEGRTAYAMSAAEADCPYADNLMRTHWVMGFRSAQADYEVK